MSDLLYLLVCVLLSSVYCAPRSKKDSHDKGFVIDQKQTGDYNIRLNLKDFQIIAVMDDDSLGDYDYNYDYADYTIKPTATKEPLSTTTKPSSSIPFNITALNNTHPYPIEPVSTTSPEITTIVDATTNQDLTSAPPMPPGKIKVQILDEVMGGVSTPQGIVPGEDVHDDIGAGVLHGELASYRRCASGFSRDKKGRCRRVRKPSGGQLPFDFGKIASSLATKLRLPNSDKRQGSLLDDV